MKLVYRGISYEYNPPEVTYPTSATSSSIKEQARSLILADRERYENRQRSILMRSIAELG